MKLDIFHPDRGGPPVVRLLDDRGRCIVAASVPFLESLRHVPRQRFDPMLRQLLEAWLEHRDSAGAIDDVAAVIES